MTAEWPLPLFVCGHPNRYQSRPATPLQPPSAELAGPCDVNDQALTGVHGDAHPDVFYLAAPLLRVQNA
jgi:hypothetical protein